MEALFAAHDGIAQLIDHESPVGKTGVPGTELPATHLQETLPPTTDTYLDNNIKIIKIEKTNEPLGKSLLIE